MINIDLFKQTIDEMYKMINDLKEENKILKLDIDFFKSELDNKKSRIDKYEFVDKDTI